MTVQKTIIDGITFTVGSQKLLVYQHFKLGNFDSKAISQETQIPINNVRFYISKFRHLGGAVSVVSQNFTNSRATEKSLEIEIKEEENRLVIFVKTSKEFEDYMKRTKEVLDTTRFFGENKNGKVYRLRIVEGYLDDINVPIFYNQTINFAILRVVGISDGITLPINCLLSEAQLNKAIRKLILTFKNYYKTNVENIKIHIKGEVLLETTQEIKNV